MIQLSGELRVAEWGAILLDPVSGHEETCGAAVPADAVPMAQRRRMPRFALAAVRCALGVMTPNGETVFASRYGDVPTAVTLLQAIAQGELLSPTAFSACVHNAAPGLAGQIAGVKASHTAVAAGEDSLAAGVLEARLRLATGEAGEVSVVFADLPLPEAFGDFEREAQGAVCLGMRLVAVRERGACEPVAAIEPGRRGAAALVRALEAGVTLITLKPAALTALAA